MREKKDIVNKETFMKEERIVIIEKKKWIGIMGVDKRLIIWFRIIKIQIMVRIRRHKV